MTKFWASADEALLDVVQDGITIAEVEIVLADSFLDPNLVVTAGIFRGPARSG